MDARFGDRYNKFASTIDTNVIKLETTQEDFANTQEALQTTAGVIKTIMEKLRAQKFQDFDINKDGNVTEEEFNQGLLNLQQ